MEKINDILKPLIGLLLLFTFIVAFSSCEQKPKQEVIDRDTVEARDTASRYETKDTTTWRTRVGLEEKDMDAKYDSLKAKAKLKGKKAEKEVDRVIENLKKERDEIKAGDTDEKAEEKWTKFKEKSKAALDSLDKKF